MVRPRLVVDGRQPLPVIIIAPPEDLHALTVAWEIRQCGGAVLMLNTADFPNLWSISLTADEDDTPRFDIVTTEGVVTDAAISGVWWRRTRPFAISEAINDDKHRRLCRDDCAALFEGWIYALGARVINPLAAELAARRKPFQLANARRCGFRHPSTVISSSPDDVTALLSRHDGEFIYKSLTTPASMIVETRPLDAEARSNLALLRFSPCIIQRRIDGGADIRATIVEDEIFAAEIRAHHPGAQLDWRLDAAVDVRTHTLPDEVAGAIRRMQKELGLRYGAYDLRRDAEGEYWFFEVNPGGQYLFVEIATEQKISRAIARALIAAPAAASIAAG
ncbi:hypothetical protein JQ557_02230 [Bradyrhizobium sp. U87765 SZCCT0131]|uniref:MvdC/MvdD family ATP grasp protein n=1 Tax=unclassified Bradyrhizobium TaxID=2631580 RepID=UPI001BA898FE|nr:MULTISPECIES: hypothetical protein [unclassified Bradyrhizobium]MBR1216792.1 hypothetical protein [Bradyrhizobium sp. U87765 SZCCT0131]MBR1259452.1 hypothetical protein [Bradyrhizobium sp. U87765 SZCCT0134]MBR1305593.1 hypothetical protein [Bradyrhizobium sp. U87765 SZCCT0110]MBR1321960.1 hypothetical protein [Bradyrhizobium sp. U87765 SZCCT0109]MBR1350762.1 hypothetical protein [Bradyrhizobium sp. U87765 SZCCT0048]